MTFDASSHDKWHSSSVDRSSPTNNANYRIGGRPRRIFRVSSDIRDDCGGLGFFEDIGEISIQIK